VPPEASIRKLTIAEYLAGKRQGSQRHVYSDGEVFAMAGASLSHNRIVRNALVELTTQLRGGEYEALPSDLRVRLSNSARYVYPDVSVVCGTPKLEDSELDTLTNPTSIVEVPSASTEAFDRGEKFATYRGLSSFREYLLISSTREHVEHFTRREDGIWELREYGSGQTLSAVDERVKLDVRTLYAGVSFGEG
jgi:Uma2 family endonuclease